MSHRTAHHRRSTVVRTTGARSKAPSDRLRGLHPTESHRLDSEPDVQIVPFRGELYTLTPEARGLCRGLIYPCLIPGALPRRPLTRGSNGAVWAGPNAVLGPPGGYRDHGRHADWWRAVLSGLPRWPGATGGPEPRGVARCGQVRVRQAAPAVRAGGAFRPAEFRSGGGARQAVSATAQWSRLRLASTPTSCTSSTHRARRHSVLGHRPAHCDQADQTLDLSSLRTPFTPPADLALSASPEAELLTSPYR